MLRETLLVMAIGPMAALAFAPPTPALRAHWSGAAARGAVSAAPSRRSASPAAARFPRGLRMAEVESATSASAGLEVLKSDLMTQLSVGSGLKGAADSANRAEINELVLKLETQNPTAQPAESPLLNGVWELLYTGGCAPHPTRLRSLCALAWPPAVPRPGGAQRAGTRGGRWCAATHAAGALAGTVWASSIARPGKSRLRCTRVGSGRVCSPTS